jgi:hypothetical protein
MHTIWYLNKKGYISRADNADFTLMAEGVDFVEAQRLQIPVLNKMLTSESGISNPSPGDGVIQTAEPGPIELPSIMPAPVQAERRGPTERRTQKDGRRRLTKTEPASAVSPIR